MDADPKTRRLVDLHGQIERTIGQQFEEPAILLGYVVVSEWADGSGRSRLLFNCSDQAGNSLPSWRYNGMLHEALYGDWDDPDADDE